MACDPSASKSSKASRNSISMAGSISSSYSMSTAPPLAFFFGRLVEHAFPKPVARCKVDAFGKFDWTAFLASSSGGVYSGSFAGHSLVFDQTALLRNRSSFRFVLYCLRKMLEMRLRSILERILWAASRLSVVAQYRVKQTPKQ